MIGASSLGYSRNRRIIAQMTGRPNEAFDATRVLCKRDEAMFVDRTVAHVANHFRTPSPGGQVSCPHAGLPVYLFAETVWRLLAQDRVTWRHYLHYSQKPPFVCESSQNEKRGKFPCCLLYTSDAADE